MVLPENICGKFEGSGISFPWLFDLLKGSPNNNHC